MLSDAFKEVAIKEAHIYLLAFSATKMVDLVDHIIHDSYPGSGARPIGLPFLTDELRELRELLAATMQETQQMVRKGKISRALAVEAASRRNGFDVTASTGSLGAC